MPKISKIQQLSNRLEQIKSPLDTPLEDISSKLDRTGKVQKLTKNIFGFLTRIANIVSISSGSRSSKTLKVDWLKQSFDWIDKEGVENEINAILKYPTKEGYTKLLEVRNRLKALKNDPSNIYIMALGKVSSERAQKITSLFDLIEHVELRPFALREIEMAKTEYGGETTIPQSQETLDLSKIKDVFDQDFTRKGVEVSIDGFDLERLEVGNRSNKLKKVKQFLDIHIGNKNQKWKEAIRKISTQFLVKKVSGDADIINSGVAAGFQVDPVMRTVKYKGDGYRAKINVKLEKNNEKEVTKATFEVIYEADWTYDLNGHKEVLKTERMSQTFSLTNESGNWILKPLLIV